MARGGTRQDRKFSNQYNNAVELIQIFMQTILHLHLFDLIVLPVL